MHSGFFDAYYSLSSQVIPAVQGYLNEHNDATIIVTGHSLGAAMSTFAALDKVSASLEVNYTSSGIASYYTASIVPSNTSNFTVTALANIQGNYPYTTIGASYFADSEGGDIPTGSNQLAFSTGLSSFYSPNYIFLPSWASGSRTYTSSLYDRYGDIDYPFQLGVFDIFSSYDISGSYFETRIADVQIITGSITPTNQYVLLTFMDDIPLSSKHQLENLYVTQNKPATFLFLKRVQDETNAYLKFTKRPGQTSYGFLIPENLSPDVLNNIDTITSQVKQKLVNDQGNIIGDLTGGGF